MTWSGCGQSIPIYVLSYALWRVILMCWPLPVQEEQHAAAEAEAIGGDVEEMFIGCACGHGWHCWQQLRFPISIETCMTRWTAALVITHQQLHEGVALQFFGSLSVPCNTIPAIPSQYLVTTACVKTRAGIQWCHHQPIIDHQLTASRTTAGKEQDGCCHNQDTRPVISWKAYHGLSAQHVLLIHVLLIN